MSKSRNFNGLQLEVDVDVEVRGVGMEEEKKYRLPDLKKEADWFKCLILSFKTLKGFEYNDRGWDIGNFARCTRAAKNLLEICGSLRAADTCMVEIGKYFDDNGLEWTLETICSRAPEWIQKKRGGNASRNASRSRFFAAMSQRRAIEKSKNPLSQIETKTILDSVRGLQIAEDSSNGKDGQ